jgi:hypothetical protein
MNKIANTVEVIFFRSRFLLATLYKSFVDANMDWINDKREFQGTHS